MTVFFLSLKELRLGARPPEVAEACRHPQRALPVSVPALPLKSLPKRRVPAARRSHPSATPEIGKAKTEK